MKQKIIALALAVCLLAACLCGCSAFSGIAESVADAAMAELKTQIENAIEENQVDVVELKSAFGTLNDDGGSLQFFCAILVRSDSADLAAAAAEHVVGGFDDFGVMAQTDSAIESEHLVHKSLSYDHTDFSDGNYYTVFLYAKSFSLEDLTGNTFATSGS